MRTIIIKEPIANIELITPNGTTSFQVPKDRQSFYLDIKSASPNGKTIEFKFVY